ncbi:alpha/beta hydrolase [Acidobacteria bacterium AB60]|nr:alpha/beta hydrolase [Acidobacteria bacterium AB60]
MRKRYGVACIVSTAIVVACAALIARAEPVPPKPPGKLVSLGGHKLHVHCTGRGVPAVVVESGLGDFSFDWILVQEQVSRFTRICTYDRAGYAWSEPGPRPRTFDQLNLELHDALLKLGKRGPYVLVGHSYGGPVARNFALTYPHLVAGLVFVDSAFEGERIPIGGGKTLRLGDGAKGVAIPSPRETVTEPDRPTMRAEDLPPEVKSLDPMFKALPPAEQKLQVWAQQLPGVYGAEGSETEWSADYFTRWLAKSQAGALGKIPVVVLTRAESGYGNDLEIPAAQLDKERKDGQARLALLSSNHRQIIVHSGHNMNLEAPADVTAAIREDVEAIRNKSNLE